MLERLKNNGSSLKNRITAVLALTVGLGACDSNDRRPPVDHTGNNVPAPTQQVEEHNLEWKVKNVTVFRGQYEDCVDREFVKGKTGDDCPTESFTLDTLTTRPAFGLEGNTYYDAIENTQSDPELQLETIKRATNFSWWAIKFIKSPEAQLEALPKITFYSHVCKLHELRTVSCSGPSFDYYYALLNLQKFFTKVTDSRVTQKALELSRFNTVEEVTNELEKVYATLSEPERSMGDRERKEMETK